MKKTSVKRVLPNLVAVFAAVFLIEGTGFCAGEKKDEAKPSSELLTRIDFGNSYITGQTLKSGAVYLLQRKKSDVKSMLKYRENYRKEILEAHDIREKDDDNEK